MRLLLLAALFLCAATGRAEPIQSPAAAHSALYSYSDVYRLTVAGAAMADFPLAAAGESQAFSQSAGGALRVAAGDAAASYRFAIRAVEAPGRWLLILAGVAIGLWVARRRLANRL
jgi:hypothetical protein